MDSVKETTTMRMSVSLRTEETDQTTIEGDKATTETETPEFASTVAKLVT